MAQARARGGADAFWIAAVSYCIAAVAYCSAAVAYWAAASGYWIGVRGIECWPARSPATAAAAVAGRSSRVGTRSSCSAADPAKA